MNVKVADFGFSENMYSRAYVHIVVDGGVRMPVKWMAPCRKHSGWSLLGEE